MSRDGYLPPGCTQDEIDRANEDPNDDPDFRGVDEPPEPPPPPFYSVAMVLHDRAYGGPEEGGWYYETYQLETHPPAELCPVICKTEDEAHAASIDMRNTIERLGLNEGRREISSVLSEGLYVARIFDGFPRSEPQQRPYYE